MSEITAPRQPYYSFLRPGDFAMSIFLLGMTVFRFHSSFMPGLNRDQTIWSFGGATLSLLSLTWFVWLRYRRRHLCDDAGELIIALFLPITFTVISDHVTSGVLHRGWWPDLGYPLLLLYFGFRVWRAPQKARELQAKDAACEVRDFTNQGGL